MSYSFETATAMNSEIHQNEAVAHQQASSINTPTSASAHDFSLSPIDEQHRIAKRNMKSVKKNQKDITKAYRTRSQNIQYPNVLRNVADLALELSERVSAKPFAEAKPAIKLRLIVNEKPATKIGLNVKEQPTPKIRLIVNKEKPATKLILKVNKPTPAPKLRLIVNKDKPATKLIFKVNKPTPAPKLRLTFKNSAFFRSLDRQRTQTGLAELGTLRNPLPPPTRNPLPSTPTSEAKQVSFCSPTTRLHLARSKRNKENRKQGRECVPWPANTPQTANKFHINKELHELSQKGRIERFTQRQQAKISETTAEAQKLSDIIKTFEADPRSYKPTLSSISPQLEVDIGKSHDSLSTLPYTSTPAISKVQDQWIRNYLPRKPSLLSSVKLPETEHSQKRLFESDPEEFILPLRQAKRMRLWNNMDDLDITQLPF
ncbi:uncharacterized protein PAC_02250 [Phialocephala subalpina]|uniref:Uncharacterized protein n=1 Tax=Phialocephala subalpina TaxID=576137 RepID=A0A1L7WHX0_9HELO|nr:uncharacterized protein PAC_02250 [Phialocephala subalpina]